MKTIIDDDNDSILESPPLVVISELSRKIYKSQGMNDIKMTNYTLYGINNCTLKRLLSL